MSLAALLLAASSLTYLPTVERGTCCAVIAHAAGAIDGNALTNSQDALEANFAIGTRIFEIDFSPTSDGVLAATHDWGYWHLLVPSAAKGTPTAAEFSAAKLKARPTGHGVPGLYRPMTFADVERFLAKHPSARVVTDTKYDLSAVVDAVKHSKVRNQFLIQAYSLEDVDALVNAGFARRIILTIYKMNVAYAGPSSLQQFVAKMDKVRHHLFAVTVPLSFAMRGHNVATLAEHRVPVLVHGQPQEINSRQVQQHLRKLGAAGLYLD